MRAPLHLALVAYGSLERRSGGNLYDQKIVDTLRQRGHRVEEVSLPAVPAYAARLLDNFSRAHRRSLCRPAFDLLVEDELVHPSLFLLNRRLARRRPALPRVAIVHHLRASERHPAVLLPLYRAIERSFLRTIDAFVFNSSDTRGRVEQLLGRSTRAVVATPGGDRLARGISPELVARRARQPGPLRVVFVGNVIPRKGLGELLEALARLAPQECTLEVIGDTACDRGHARAMQRRAAVLGLGEQVRFLGAVDDRTLALRLEHAQLLAVPSTFEGFGIVYLEAMAFGLPAVATTSGGAAGIVTDGETGFLIPPRDADTLAQRLGTLARDRELLGRLGSAALHAFARFPGWAASAGRAADFLEAIHGERMALGRRSAA